MTARRADRGVDSLPSRQDWVGILGDAARVGLLTDTGPGMWQIHPALPAYLAALWRTEDAEGYTSARDAAARALADAYAEFGMWLTNEFVRGDVRLAATTAKLHQRTLSAQLGYALDKKLWQQARWITEPLRSYWMTEGKDSEAEAWTDRVRQATKDADGAPPAADSHAGRLWLSFTVAQAGRHSGRAHSDDGQSTLSEILAKLRAEPPSRERQICMSDIFVKLGVAAQDRGELVQHIVSP